jgi:hypothetical protein
MVSVWERRRHDWREEGNAVRCADFTANPAETVH